MQLIKPDDLALHFERKARQLGSCGQLAEANGYATAAVVLRFAPFLPTIEAEPVRHGEWIYHHAAPEGWKVCSVCLEKAHHPAGGDPYCHNCGAKMDGGRTNE